MLKPLSAKRKARSVATSLDLYLALAVLAVLAIGIVLLARGLPARGFFVGDPGVKLIAARNVIAHPWRPFDVDLPSIGRRPVPMMDPFFQIHDGHAHATTSVLFPLVSAPLIAAFGLQGAYVLPAVGFLLTVWAIGWVGLELDARRSRWFLLVVTAVCTPFLFYGLEFWEHTLAAGFAAVGTALFVRHTGRPSQRVFWSGAILGLSILLRPEAAWYLVAVAAASRWLPERSSLRAVALLAAGAAVVCIPFAVTSLVHSGTGLGGHVTGNLSGLGHEWLSRRLQIVTTWFGAGEPWWTLVLLLCIGSGLFSVIRKRGAAHVAILLAATAVSVLAARRHFPVASLMNAAPASLVAVLAFGGRDREGQEFLSAVIAVFVLLVILTAPNDGGGQWGPRYLLLAFVPASILITDVLAGVATAAPRKGAVACLAILGVSLFIQRAAYKDLRSAKQTYARITSFVESNTRAGGCIFTDLWWLDQVTASLYGTRQFIFIDRTSAGENIRTIAAGCNGAYVIWSPEESPQGAIARWIAMTSPIQPVARTRDRNLLLAPIS